MNPEPVEVSSSYGGFLPCRILLLFFVVHIVFGFIADRQRIRENRWHGTICVVSTFVCWVGAFLFDNVHHGI